MRQNHRTVRRGRLQKPVPLDDHVSARIVRRIKDELRAAYQDWYDALDEAQYFEPGEEYLAHALLGFYGENVCGARANRREDILFGKNRRRSIT